MAKHVWAAAGLIALMVSVSGRLVFAQAATAPSGHWEGTLQVPGQELKFEIDLAAAGEKWEATITIPSQGLKSFPLSDVTVQGDTVSFTMKGVPGAPSFKGTLSKDGKALSGDFTQGGGTIPFSLVRTGEAKIERPPNSTPITKDLEGSWEGTVDVDGNKLRLILKLSTQPDGSPAGTLVSVDQGGAEIPVATIVQTGAHLKLLVTAVNGTYEGDLKDGELTGTWTQGPRSFPLVFKRSK